VDHEPLPSCDLDIIRAGIKAPEVDSVFHVQLSELVSPSRLRHSMFRGQRPYSAVNVSDIVRGTPIGLGVRTEALEDDTEIGTGKNEGDLEIWGLTGWYLNLLLRALKLEI